MSRGPDYSDDMLASFLKGEGDNATHKALILDLTKSEELRARIDAISASLSNIRPAFDTREEGITPRLIQTSPIHPAPPSPPKAATPLKTITAALVTLGIGFGMGQILRSNPGANLGWHDYVAAYQALYVPDTLNVITQTPQARSAQLQRVASALGRPLSVAMQVPGLEYKRAQILGFRGKPLIQMAYTTVDGIPVALCILRSTKTSDLKTMQLEGMKSAIWFDGQFGYLLIGSEDAKLVRHAAKHLQAVL